ncbi:MAG: hypothetical protein ACYTDY_05905 [Planctomycetota bacterium]|jgi:hypothetical protein
MTRWADAYAAITAVAAIALLVAVLACAWAWAGEIRPTHLTRHIEVKERAWMEPPGLLRDLRYAGKAAWATGGLLVALWMFLVFRPSRLGRPDPLVAGFRIGVLALLVGVWGAADGLRQAGESANAVSPWLYTCWDLHADLARALASVRVAAIAGALSLLSGWLAAAVRRGGE